MAKQSLEYCSLSYLNQWLTHDKKYCDVLNSSNSTLKEKSDILKKAGSFYSVARNLPTKYDTGEGLERYQPLIEILDSINVSQFTEGNCVDLISNLEKQISGIYNCNVLSLTTKFVWFKVKSPVLIFDKNARGALDEINGNTKKDRIQSKDFSSFCLNWHKAFDREKDNIKMACDKLPDMSLYAVDAETISREYIESIVSEDWFLERVFDNYLWGVGAPKL